MTMSEFLQSLKKKKHHKLKNIHSNVQNYNEKSKLCYFFFKGKANTIRQYLQFRVQHLLLLHSRKKEHPRFIRLLALSTRSLLITIGAWPPQDRDGIHLS